MGALLAAWLLRHRWRTALTVGAMQLAVASICILLAAPAELAAFLAERTSDARLAVTHRSGLSYGLPPSLARRIRDLPEVEEVMASTYFGGSVERDGRVGFPSVVVDASRVARLYPDYRLPLESLAAFERRRDAALVGEQTLRRYGWRLGDRIELASALWGVTLDAEIVGSLPSQPGVWLQEARLDEALRAHGRGGLPWRTLLWLRPAAGGGDRTRSDGADPGLGVASRVESLGRELGVPLAVASERAFFSVLLADVRGFAALLHLVGALVAACIAVVAASAISLAVRERSRDVATLRALGWSRARLAVLVLGESALLGLAGGVGGMLGAIVCAGLGQQVADAAGVDGLATLLGAMRVDAATAASTVLAAVSIGCVAGLVPALGVGRGSVPAALREVAA